MKASHNSLALQALAQSISKARRVAGIKQITASKILGISRSTLSKYENGQEVPTVPILIAMSQLYEQPTGSFFPAIPCSDFITATVQVQALPTLALTGQLEQLKKSMLFLIQQLP